MSNNKDTVPLSEKWESIEWDKTHFKVRQIQTRIVKYLNEGKIWKARKLQRLLRKSFYGILVSVKRATTNKGKKTSGVDKRIWDTDEAKWKAVQDIQTTKRYKPLPLKRKYIEKKNGKQRALGIPTMKDRAIQGLHLLALEPEAETKADKNSYGFRPYRSTADAIEQCFKTLSNRNNAKWIMEGDIKGCFDNINHDWLIDNIPTDKSVLRKWLKAGFIYKKKLYPTEAGTPQGGIISPVIANMTLDGLEIILNKRFKNKKVNYVRYADDFIVTGKTKEILETEILPVIKDFLLERGLTLSKEKTKITHIKEGFDFLGFNIRKYKEKLIIKPGEENIKDIRRKIKETIKRNRQAKHINLIGKLNPIINGWGNYYRHACSKNTFSEIDNYIFHRLWHWAKRRHPNKNSKWIKRKYFKVIGASIWNFATNNAVLKKMAKIHIIRHKKIRHEANPYDKEQEIYFEKRWAMINNIKASITKRKLWMLQNGKCKCCDKEIDLNEKSELHVISFADIKKDFPITRTKLLHPECHAKVHNKIIKIVNKVQVWVS